MCEVADVVVCLPSFQKVSPTYTKPIIVRLYKQNLYRMNINLDPIESQDLTGAFKITNLIVAGLSVCITISNIT